MKMLPKSLHTITAIVNVGRFISQEDSICASLHDMPRSMQGYANRAAEILGYTDCDDNYGLLAKAAIALDNDAGCRYSAAWYEANQQANVSGLPLFNAPNENGLTA